MNTATPSLEPDFSAFFNHAKHSRLKPFLPALYQALQQTVEKGHGDLPRWLAALDALPDVSCSSVDLQADTVRAGLPTDATDEQLQALREALQGLHPWRKGPFDIAGVHVDTEWRSDWKWQRLVPHISPLQGRKVLDIGCGSGYHLWRMLGEGANMALGIDPSWLFWCQFEALKRYLGALPAYYLPLGIEALPAGMQCFETVFSMGVLYHRRSPMDHLLELRDLLMPGGELVLETLVIEGEEGQVLVPSGRYARMGNVWFLPSVPTLLAWLAKCGFRDAQVVVVTPTTTGEQRSTDWMRFQSLADFLDPLDSSRTLEGYPAPIRAVFVAQAPG